jgi:hypothetical protein
MGLRVQIPPLHELREADDLASQLPQGADQGLTEVADDPRG